MKKINVAELLKDCSSGMELDCTMYEDVYFDYVDELNIIHCYILYETHRTSITFNQHGTPNSNIKSKCVIFPKGKTTWEGFHIPFKDGDIVTCKDRGSLIAFIYKERKNDAVVNYHFALYAGGVGTFIDGEICLAESELVFATEEEKQKLFQAIKDNGYKWNPETKTLEKLPKFKVGDRIRRKNNTTITQIIGYVYHDSYALYDGRLLFFKEQDQYELVPDKFEISRLKPFDKVLVRNSNNGKWCGQFYMAYNKNEDYPFECTYNCWMQCIPYEGNEYLRNTTDACSPFYKTWE